MGGPLQSLGAAAILSELDIGQRPALGLDVGGPAQIQKETRRLQRPAGRWPGGPVAWMGAEAAERRPGKLAARGSAAAAGPSGIFVEAIQPCLGQEIFPTPRLQETLRPLRCAVPLAEGPFARSLGFQSTQLSEKGGLEPGTD